MYELNKPKVRIAKSRIGNCSIRDGVHTVSLDSGCGGSTIEIIPNFIVVLLTLISLLPESIVSWFSVPYNWSHHFPKLNRVDFGDKRIALLGIKYLLHSHISYIARVVSV